MSENRLDTKSYFVILMPQEKLLQFLFQHLALQTSKRKPNLMDTYVIKSWWKMGGNRNLLESHMDECKAQLGAAHYPDKKTFTFTRGFAICMRQHGWRGLVEKRS